MISGVRPKISNIRNDNYYEILSPGFTLTTVNVEVSKNQ